MPEDLFHLVTPFLGLGEKNLDGISSPGPSASTANPTPWRPQTHHLPQYPEAQGKHLGLFWKQAILPPPYDLQSTPVPHPQSTVLTVELRVRRVLAVCLLSCVILNKLVKLSEPQKKD